MKTSAIVESPRMGRRPADNPLNVQINFRVDEETAQRLDATLKDMMKQVPGITFSRGDVARMLMLEAMTARSKRGK